MNRRIGNPPADAMAGGGTRQGRVAARRKVDAVKNTGTARGGGTAKPSFSERDNERKAMESSKSMDSGNGMSAGGDPFIGCVKEFLSSPAKLSMSSCWKLALEAARKNGWATRGYRATRLALGRLATFSRSEDAGSTKDQGRMRLRNSTRNAGEERAAELPSEPPPRNGRHCRSSSQTGRRYDGNGVASRRRGRADLRAMQAPNVHFTNQELRRRSGILAARAEPAGPMEAVCKFCGAAKMRDAMARHIRRQHRRELEAIPAQSFN